MFAPMLKEYEAYKRGYHQDIQYPMVLTSKVTHSLHIVNLVLLYKFTTTHPKLPAELYADDCVQSLPGVPT